MNTEPLQNVTETPSALGPGSRLQQARIKKNLDLEQVARKLHLSKQHVEAIERDDYSYVSALAYARGHLRMYAKLVDLTPNEILKAFDALQLKDPTPATPALSQPSVKTKYKPLPLKVSSKKMGSIIGIAGVAILGFAIIAGTIAWQHNNRQQKRKANIATAAQQITAPASQPIDVTKDTNTTAPIPLTIPQQPNSTTTPPANTSVPASTTTPANEPPMPRGIDHSTE